MVHLMLHPKSIIQLLWLFTVAVRSSPIDDWVMQNAKFQPPLSPTSVLPGRYLLELTPTSSPAASSFSPLLYFQQIYEEQSFESSSARMNLSIHHTYDNPAIFYGASIGFDLVSSQEIMTSSSGRYQRLLDDFFSHDAIEKIYPVSVIPRPATIARQSFKNITQQLPSDLGALGFPFNLAAEQLNLAHEAGYLGQGILVGIVDSGVDYTHPALGGGFGPGYKVTVGYDFVGNHFNVRDRSSRKERPNPLDDCAASHLDDSGHGTHVTGIVAANDKRYNFTGVAPEAQIGMWRVFSCNGSTTSDLVIKGLISAFEAGCDIINLSLGGPNNWAQDVSSLVANRIAKKGVPVVIAAGNDGERGAFYISSPSTGKQVISVASINNNVTLAMTMQANNRSFIYELSSSTSVFPNGTLVAYADSSNDNDLACIGSISNPSISDKIVLVRRGNCTFTEKAQVAADHGAIGLVIYDPEHPTMASSPMTDGAKIPVASIPGDAGRYLLDTMTPDGIAVIFGTALTPQPVSTGGQVSDFSSVGPTYEIGLKPNVAGIGGYVFSTLPVAAGGYGILSGTSMASPFVAGCVALFLQSEREKRFDGVYSHANRVMEKFMNYAHPAHFADPALLDHPVKQGAGLIQVYDTIEGTLHVSPSYISFNDSSHRQEPQNLTITNYGSAPVEVEVVDQDHSVSLVPYNTSLQGYAPLEPVRYGNVKARLSLTSSEHHWIIPPGGHVSIQVSITSIDYGDGEDDPLTMSAASEPELPYPIFGGFLHIKSALENLRVPYFGIQGNVEDLPIFDTGYPRLTPEAMVVRFLTGTAMFVAEVWDEEVSEFIGYAAVHTFLPRDTSKTHRLTVFPWSHTVLVNPPPVPAPKAATHTVRHLPSGTYVMIWKALKLLADPSLASSWESVTSKPFDI